jgi:ABC-type multidrug transport system ATPase subunit
MSHFYRKDLMDVVTMETCGLPVDIESAEDIIPQKQEMINLEWTNVSYCTIGPKGEKKTIIHPMSGHAEPGKMLAIMGTSGAGKSTLLDILSGRLLSNNMSGQILANDKPVNFASFRKKAAYVKQNDSLFPHLTVKETLHYAAHLGIHGKTYEEREIAALKTMYLLGLGHVQDTLIGDNSIRGLSGGEKRRVSIAVDIIHGPRLIFLDEPTSGKTCYCACPNIQVFSSPGF